MKFRWMRGILAVALAAITALPAQAQGVAADNTPPKVAPPSRTACPFPLVMALHEGEKRFAPMGWQCNAEQLAFLKNTTPYRQYFPQIPELTGYAGTATEVKKYFADKSIALPLKDGGEATVAGYLKWEQAWHVVGRDYTDKYEGVDYQFALVDAGVTYYTSPAHPSKIAGVETKSGDFVFLAPLDLATHDQPLIPRVMAIMAGFQPYESKELKGITFPAARIDRTESHDWLKGLTAPPLKAGDRPFVATQAVQRTKFWIDHTGAGVESAAAIAFARGIGPRPYAIDRPYLAWVMRKGIPLPLFACFISTDAWVKSVPKKAE